MLEDGTMEWQGSLRKTYDKYLNPAVLDYNSKEMWDLVGNGAISSLFQFDTLVGSQAIKDIQPRSLYELASSSSLMRLMSDGELPLAKYARFKRVPELWYNEMREYGLNESEVHVLEKYLAKKSGVGESQEVIMQIVMDPQISGFDMKEANKLRKTIAKKKFREIEVVKQLFYDKGHSIGTSENMLNYVWNVQVNYQLGYSFSEIHTTAYALIALQEMNLAYKYPIIYWNTACLSVDSSAINAADFYNLIDDDIIDASEETEGKKIANKMDYTKMASALDKFKRICNIELPDINNSRLSFTPDVKNNTILYGLKGICKVTDPAIEEIMLNRPFKSLDDFINKVTKKIVTKDKIINLIKCGAFNKIENKTTKEILKQYIWSICEPKKKLTLQNANMLIDLNLLPTELESNCDCYKLTKELRKHRDKNKIWYCGDRLSIPMDKLDSWKALIKESGVISQEVIIDNEPRKVIDSDRWDSFYESKMDKIRVYIKTNHDELLNKLNNTLFENEFNKYCSGDEKQWELDSINFFFNGHPLDKVIPQLSEAENIEITNNLDDIVEGAQDGNFVIKDKIIPRMKLYTIAGTVIDKDKVKGLVTVQCPAGVVNIKIYKDLFATLVQTTETQDSFLEKGNHLLITGIQRGATFVPKVYKNLKRNAIMRIVVDENGNYIKLEEKE